MMNTPPITTTTNNISNDNNNTNNGSTSVNLNHNNTNINNLIIRGPSPATVSDILDNTDDSILQDALNELQDNEPHTVKEIQEAINESHPFGLKIWKPALYKKNRSIEENLFYSLHPSSFSSSSSWFSLRNIVWTVFCGWWLALTYLKPILLGFLPAYLVLSFIHFVSSFASCGRDTEFNRSLIRGRLRLRALCSSFFKFSCYVLYPFGRYLVQKKVNTFEIRRSSSPSSSSSQFDNNRGENEDEDDAAPLLNDTAFSHDRYRYELEDDQPAPYLDKIIDVSTIVKLLKQSSGTALFTKIIILFFLAPVHLFISFVCFFFVFTIPMAKFSSTFFTHIFMHPLSLEILSKQDLLTLSIKQHSENEDTSSNEEGQQQVPRRRPHTSENSVVSIADNLSLIICIQHAMGFQYYKYTVDGINIVFINLISVVIFSLVDYFYIGPHFGYSGIASHSVIFIGSLLSVVPLAYFIGMSVSSITAQTGSLALGAVINASFGSIIEIILYGLALMEGKERLVEGSIIGSFLCGTLALPGAAMFAGGLQKKEQRFNAKAAGITSTMLILALIGVFTPTVFQNLYGSFELRCQDCPPHKTEINASPSPHLLCKTCFYTQPHPTLDPIYQSRTKPLMYVCAIVLVLTYAIGLLFTLRTHAKKIYPQTPHMNEQRQPQPGRPESTARFQSFPSSERSSRVGGSSYGGYNTRVPTTSQARSQLDALRRRKVQGNILSTYGSGIYVQSPIFQEAGHHEEDPIPSPMPPPMLPPPPFREDNISEPQSPDFSRYGEEYRSPSIHDALGESGGGGHDNPNWGTTKSILVLLMSTVAFSLIAEILVGSIDVLLKSVHGIDEKFVGLTLIAIIPSVTEFYNAIAFAMNGNIVLGLEIGSAYTIQVALLQIPALVAISSWIAHGHLYNLNSNITASSSLPTSHPTPFVKTFALIQSFFTYIFDFFSQKQPFMQKQNLNPANSSALFTLVFPRWDFYAVLFSTFLLTYIYIEGKSNYFKGSILILAYVILVAAFYVIPKDFIV